jgi:serine/threonine-protein kinase RsbW
MTAGPGQGGGPVSRRFILSKSEIGSAVAFAAGAAKQFGWPRTDIDGLEVCSEELLANLFFHGGIDGAEVEISVAAGGGLTVIDNGKPFDPAAAPGGRVETTLAQQAVGGLGLGLIHRLCNAITYERSGGRNVVHVQFGAPNGA